MSLMESKCLNLPPRPGALCSKSRVDGGGFFPAALPRRCLVHPLSDAAASYGVLFWPAGHSVTSALDFRPSAFLGGSQEQNLPFLLREYSHRTQAVYFMSLFLDGLHEFLQLW